MLGVLWNPSSFLSFFPIVDEFFSKSRHLIWILFAAQYWALCLIRNKKIIEPKCFCAIFFIELTRVDGHDEI